VFKKALGWLASPLEPIQKPVVLLNASASGGHQVHAQCVEILAILNTRILGEALPEPGASPDDQDVGAHRALP